MPLRPDVEALRRQRIAAGTRPLPELSVAEAREAERADLEQGGEPEPVAEVVDGSLPGPAGPIPIRVYRPRSAHPLPALVYFFGGGWVTGSLDTGDRVCRRLANSTPCAVVAVAYRRGPGAPVPCRVDPRRLAVGGASAGGNLAAACAQLALERGAPRPRFQLLVYPRLDHRADTPTMRETVDRVFDHIDLAWGWAHYLACDSDGESPAPPTRRKP